MFSVDSLSLIFDLWDVYKKKVFRMGITLTNMTYHDRFEAGCSTL